MILKAKAETLCLKTLDCISHNANHYGLDHGGASSGRIELAGHCRLSSEFLVWASGLLVAIPTQRVDGNEQTYVLGASLLVAEVFFFAGILAVGCRRIKVDWREETSKTVEEEK